MNGFSGIRARLVQAEVVSGIDAATLQTALNAWFDAAEEIEFLYASDPAWTGTNLVVVIYYSE